MLKNGFYFLAPFMFLVALMVITITARETVPQMACGTTDFTGLTSFDSKAIFEGFDVVAPTVMAYKKPETQVLGVASPQDKWIEVDLSEQKLYAWDGEELFLESKVSTGLPHTPTPTGQFRVWIKLRSTKMEGGEGRYYYYLPNVPYVMFFENEDIPGWRGYGIHGTYWHSDFGTQRSHGCVNTPTPVAEQLYYWATPVTPDGKYTVYADEENPGIRVIIHD